MPHEKALTIQFVAKAILKKELISKEEYKDILKNGEARRKKLQKYQEATFSKRFHQAPDLVSPAEVISSFNIKIPGKSSKILTEDEITEAIAKEVGLPYKKIDPLKLNPEMVNSYVPRPFATKHLLVPIDETDGYVTIAVAEPHNLEAVKLLESAKKIKIKPVLSSKSDILKIIREFSGFSASVSAAEKEISLEDEIGNLEQYIKLKDKDQIEATDHNIINAVEYLLHYALDQRASDIHIEPKREKSFVRLRIDGIMHYIHKIPRSIHAPILSRIKMISGMNITEKRRPQDGRIKIDYKGKEIEFRVSTMPIAHGEKIVIRIFDPEVLLQDISQLGFYPREYQIYNAFIRKPNGIILVTGPTGSGKTTTLYSSLKALSSPEINIVTIEDPIEIIVEEFNQIGVQPSIGITFTDILRTILRQDPDVIMVGEIRDRETAEHSVQAALTGHLVFSTLHTNDAPSAITRLLDLGIPAFLLSSTLIGSVAQRMVRKICPHCKKERVITDEEIKYLQIEEKPFSICFGEGCRKCRGTGLIGRTGIFEIMEFTSKMKSALSEKTALSSLHKVAKKEGLVNLRQMAIMKMREGITTYEEVIAVTG